MYWNLNETLHQGGPTLIISETAQRTKNGHKMNHKEAESLLLQPSKNVRTAIRRKIHDVKKDVAQASSTLKSTRHRSIEVDEVSDPLINSAWQAVISVYRPGCLTQKVLFPLCVGEGGLDREVYKHQRFLWVVEFLVLLFGNSDILGTYEGEWTNLFDRNPHLYWVLMTSFRRRLETPATTAADICKDLGTISDVATYCIERNREVRMSASPLRDPFPSQWTSMWEGDTSLQLHMAAEVSMKNRQFRRHQSTFHGISLHTDQASDTERDSNQVLEKSEVLYKNTWLQALLPIILAHHNLNGCH